MGTLERDQEGLLCYEEEDVFLLRWWWWWYQTAPSLWISYSFRSKLDDALQSFPDLVLCTPLVVLLLLWCSAQISLSLSLSLCIVLNGFFPFSSQAVQVHDGYGKLTPPTLQEEEQQHLCPPTLFPSFLLTSQNHSPLPPPPPAPNNNNNNNNNKLQHKSSNKLPSLFGPPSLPCPAPPKQRFFLWIKRTQLHRPSLQLLFHKWVQH